METNVSNFYRCGDNCPVEQVGWDDAQEFIRILNEKTGKTCRLPTEAEWVSASPGLRSLCFISKGPKSRP